jgi:hypothetical protein
VEAHIGFCSFHKTKYGNMPRKFFSIGCVAFVVVDARTDPTMQLDNLSGIIIHALSVEDTFFQIGVFANALGLSRVSDLEVAYPGITLYNSQVTSDAVALGVFKRWGLTIRLVGDGTPNPRFDRESRIVQPACGTKQKSESVAAWTLLTSTVDGVDFRVDPISVKEVVGRRFS